MADLQKVSEIIFDYIKTKGDIKADFSINETETNEITMKDGKFTLFRTLFDNDIAIKVIKDNKKAATSINKFDKETIEKAIDEVIASAEAGSPDECFDIAPGLEPKEFFGKALTPDIEKLMNRTLELSEDIAARHKKILLIEMFAKYVRGRSIFINTNGTRDDSEYGYYEVAVEFAGNDGTASTGIAGSFLRFDNLDERLIDLGSIERDLQDAENSLNPIKISDKFEGDVILTPSCAAQMIGGTLMNSVSDYVLISKTSLWLDKLGEQVASPLLTVRNKPWDERIVVHEVHTADGFRAEDYDLIEKGVLKSFAASLYAANKCKVKPAPCSGFYLVVDAGETPYDDMVKSVKRGLIVGSVSAGAPGANGEISGVAKNAFYVENGEIKGAVIETMISGNLFDMLKNIKAISKEQTCDGMMVMPSLLVGDVTIQGN
ncbi:TldD/PmbA family protein [Butyrivibrio sp. VCD2006]|uniref:TldD/PmbA family protein n=1 Tax=Butyrivibrio sp. VCD2006 TaxID=1280664 RepID=UPI0004120240|nr:TldD/PmbA family protein [Butyrivibrio sp. VCD2006]